NYSRTYTYDSTGRPRTVTLNIGGTAYDPYAYAWDSNTGKLTQVTRPSGLVVDYAYNVTGYLCRITDNVAGVAPTCQSAQGNQSFWRANALDAEQHITQQTFGNGVVQTNAFDPDTGLVQT